MIGKWLRAHLVMLANRVRHPETQPEVAAEPERARRQEVIWEFPDGSELYFLTEHERQAFLHALMHPGEPSRSAPIRVLWGEPSGDDKR